MEKQEVVARLPWLLNDSLDPDERAAVVAELRSHADVRDELAKTRAAFELFGDHPSAEAVVDWVFGLPCDDPVAVQEHLAACRTCADHAALVRASRAFEEFETPTVVGSRAPAPFPAKLAPAELAPAELVAASATPGVSANWRWATLATGAVAALCLCGWLGLWGASHDPLTPVETTPAVTTAMVNPALDAISSYSVLGAPSLTPDSEVFRSLTQEQAITLHPGYDLVLLQLYKPQRDRGDAWTFTLVNESGQTVYAQPVTTPPRTGGKPSRYLPVAVPTAALAPGAFEVVLFAGPATGEPAARYRLRVVAAESP